MSEPPVHRETFLDVRGDLIVLRCYCAIGRDHTYDEWAERRAEWARVDGEEPEG